MLYESDARYTMYVSASVSDFFINRLNTESWSSGSWSLSQCNPDGSGSVLSGLCCEYIDDRAEDTISGSISGTCLTILLQISLLSPLTLSSLNYKLRSHKTSHTQVNIKKEAGSVATWCNSCKLSYAGMMLVLGEVIHPSPENYHCIPLGVTYWPCGESLDHSLHATQRESKFRVDV